MRIPVAGQADVDKLDAARLFRLGLESAPAGSVLHAIGDEGVPTRDIAEVLTQERLGWAPTHAGLVEDLELGHYFG